MTTETDRSRHEAGGGAIAREPDLLSFVAQVAGEDELRVEEDLGEGFVRLRVAEAERRQAKQDIRCVEDALIELLRNARDAGARAIFVATTRDASGRHLTVLDDGCGIPAEMQERVFDARVTSKLTSVHEDAWGVHGRGMALYSIRQNAEVARVMASVPGGGTAIYARFDPTSLGERTDQSTRPRVERDDDGNLVVTTGPHNLLRAATEFAIDAADRVRVFMGSPSDVIATVRAWRADGRAGECDGRAPGAQAVGAALAQAPTAAALRERAARLGLEVSERSCHRVLSGEIAPVDDLLAQARAELRPQPVRRRPVDLERDMRGLRIARDDMDEFRDAVRAAYRELARKYYLDGDCDPIVTVRSDRLTIGIDVRKER